MRRTKVWLVVAMMTVPATALAELAATVHKASVDVYARPAFGAPRLKTLRQGDAVRITAQLGLWYQLPVRPDESGYVRVNEVRLEATGSADPDASLRVLMGEKAGRGRVTETAGVRGIDESDLKSASVDRAQLDAMVGQRVDTPTAASYASGQGWVATALSYPAEPRPAKTAGQASQPTSTRAETVRAVSGLLGSLGSDLGSRLSKSEKVIPKREDELAAEEIALGPEIAGRILGLRPLLPDSDVQRRVNTVGRWVASQTSRPQLPWTFGVIDTPEVNAFAAPGGYVLVTRGLYQLLSNDAELAAVLGHEIGHCVQRDHYTVIHKQEMATSGKELAMSQAAGGASPATQFARQYAEEHGAVIMLTALDREAEFRADEAAQHYLARSGMNPLALHSVLQKLASLGPSSVGLAALYRTHPPFDARIDRLDQRGEGPLEPYTHRD